MRILYQCDVYYADDFSPFSIQGGDKGTNNYTGENCYKIGVSLRFVEVFFKTTCKRFAQEGGATSNTLSTRFLTEKNGGQRQKFITALGWLFSWK